MFNLKISPQQWIKKFHDTAGIPKQTDLDDLQRIEQLRLRRRLIQEETNEAVEEIAKAIQGNGNLYDLAKELADILVVVYGTAEVLDIPLETVYDEVMKSNMTKLDGATWRSDGKLLKGPNYQLPDIEAAFSTDSKF